MRHVGYLLPTSSSHRGQTGGVRLMPRSSFARSARTAGFRWEGEFGAAIDALLAFAASFHCSRSLIGQGDKVRASSEADESNATATNRHVLFSG